MSGGGFRLASGGLVDRNQPLAFTFDGRPITGLAGDTVASALLAAGVRVVGRSLKGHRPRGVFAAGVEEPNAVVSVDDGWTFEPMVRATEVPISAAMKVRSLNAWPNARFDIGALFGAGAGLMTAGFYYKTFLWPSWRSFEPFIRRAAGLGRLPPVVDKASYGHIHRSVDVLVIGGGPAGLADAEALIDSGLEIVLADNGLRLGGSLLAQRPAGSAAPDRLTTVEARLRAAPNVTVLKRTTVSGAYDNNVFVADEIAVGADGRQHRLWKIQARQVVLATGAIEQPLAFAGNDRPGVMLAGAVRRYLHQFGVAPGRRAAMFVNNDSGWAAASDLLDCGIEIAALIDVRPEKECHHAGTMLARGVPLRFEAGIEDVRGRSGVGAVKVRQRGRSELETIACDFLGVSGGWLPLLHLAGQRGCRARMDATTGTLMLDGLPEGWHAAGGATGSPSSAPAAGGVRAAVAAAAALGAPADSTHPTPVVEGARAKVATFQPGPGGEARTWIDFQSDVTLRDLRIAAAEGYVSIEHLKRYTTIGMAADQGRTSNLNAIASLAVATGRGVAEIGVTTFRPPFVGLKMNAIVGPRRRQLQTPCRESPLHAEHAVLNAEMADFGAWRRPDHYRSNAADRESAVAVEMAAVRGAVGVFDGSPLGKIEIAGPDAGRFIDRFYVSNMATLKVGQVRYSLMLREDGIVFDDGVLTRLADNHFLASPTSGHADQVFAHLERWRQTEWPELRVAVASVTSNWATLALSGPRSRELLARLKPEIPIDAKSLPHMRFRQGTLSGVPCRLARVSFTGELQFEVSVPARFGAALWREACAVGRDLDVRPVGMEAWLRLRVEKGYLHVGVDTDGRTVPDDVGFGPVAQHKAADFIGKRSLDLPFNRDPEREQLVGLRATAGNAIKAGGVILAPGHSHPPAPSDGRVTSAISSAGTGVSIGLALLRRGRARLGETVTIHQDGRQISVTVTRPTLYDPDNARIRA